MHIRSAVQMQLPRQCQRTQPIGRARANVLAVAVPDVNRYRRSRAEALVPQEVGRGPDRWSGAQLIEQ